MELNNLIKQQEKIITKIVFREENVIVITKQSKRIFALCIKKEIEKNDCLSRLLDEINKNKNPYAGCFYYSETTRELQYYNSVLLIKNDKEKQIEDFITKSLACFNSILETTGGILCKTI